jgi:hypothetical protein
MRSRKARGIGTGVAYGEAFGETDGFYSFFSSLFISSAKGETSSKINLVRNPGVLPEKEKIASFPRRIFHRFGRMCISVPDTTFRVLDLMHASIFMS